MNRLLALSLRLLLIVALGAAAFLLVVALLPYIAAGAARIGANRLAFTAYDLDASRVQPVLSKLVPDWAFTSAASLSGDPAYVMHLGDLAASRSTLAVSLYFAALERSRPYPRADWIEKYAGAVAVYERARAARAYLFAANLRMRNGYGCSDSALHDVDSSLLLSDDPNVRWNEARLCMGADDDRARGVLQDMVSRGQKLADVQDALGLLQWRGGDQDSARESLREAAAHAHRYQQDLDLFNRYLVANGQLRALQSAENKQVDEVNAKRGAALAGHDALYQRLRQFQCDVRQFRGWQEQSDGDLRGRCLGTQMADVITRFAGVALIAFIPEDAAAESLAGNAARDEIGEGASASAATIGTVGEVLTPAEAAGLVVRELPDGIDSSLRVRRAVYWENAFGADFSADLDAEQGAIVPAIEVYFERVRNEIVEVYSMREAGPRATEEDAVGRRNAVILRLHRRTYEFRVNLADIRPTSYTPTPPCRSGSGSAQTGSTDASRCDPAIP